jgi:hypothetical protein
LSKTSVSSFCAPSSASAFLMRMPARAARPTPTIKAVGVASPSAHGHAITRTDTAGMSPAAVPSKTAQATSVTSAMPSTTGTNTPDTLSTSRCTGGLDPCAAATSRMMPASTVPLPVPTAMHFSAPSPFTLPANTVAPGCLAIGMLSPVSIDSFTVESPSSTRPSTAMASPGRTTNPSPG